MSSRDPARCRVLHLLTRHGVSPPMAAGFVAVFAGVAVFAIATLVFPYHSANHDEAVYLYQAEMLLAGQLELHAGELAETFRPWFFVQDGGRLYPRYTPVPAAMYAISMAIFGEPRVTLGIVGAANAFLVYMLATMVFDRRVGVVAAIFYALSPFALVTTAVFLPYAPTTFFHLVFAVAYLRGIRNRSIRAAGVAGVAIGIAFFARPFTAVLFAAPFMIYSLYRLGAALPRMGERAKRAIVQRHVLTGTVGLVFVAIALAYNLRMTGSPLVFPYEAFAPRDGPGFGFRRLESHAMHYTPAVALEANAYVLWYFATRWFTAGPIGTGLALCGIGYTLGTRRRDGDTVSPDIVAVEPPRLAGDVLLCGVLASVVVGNIFFWGTRNVLGTVTDPNDGIISLLGPMYHFDLLIPLSVFAALGALVVWQMLGAATWHVPMVSGGSRAEAQTAVLVVAMVLVVTVNAAAVAVPLERNLTYTEKHERVYQPFDQRSFDDAVVFVPTPYGDWQHHPFQVLRNEPTFDGPVVYGLDLGPEANMRLLDAYPNRSVYRFTYRGEWTPNPHRHVTPKLESVTLHRGSQLEATTTVGVPANVETATVRIENRDGAYAAFSIVDPSVDVGINWSMTAAGATLLDGNASHSIPVDRTDVLAVTITLAQPDGSTLTYRQEASVRVEGDQIAVFWPPERTVCPLVTECGTAGTYLPDTPTAHTEGVRFETRLHADSDD